MREELEELRWFTTTSLVEAVLAGEVLLSPPVSIAFQLLAGWFRQQGGGELEAVYREAQERHAARKATSATG